MRKAWEAMGTIIVTMFAIYLFYELLKPYALLIVAAFVLFFIGHRIYKHERRM